MQLSGPELIAQISAAANSGEREFVVPPGDYTFASQSEPVDLKLHDFILRADGARFVFDPPSRPEAITLRKCRDAKIVGLTVDFDPPPFVQGVVREIDPGRKLVKVELESDTDLPTTREKAAASLAISGDPSGGPRSTTKIAASETRGRNLALTLADERWFDAKHPLVALGETIVVAGDSQCDAIHLVDCQNLEFERVRIHACSGNGFSERGGGGNRFLGCEVGPRPGSGQRLAALGNAFRSGGSKPGPQLVGCRFSQTVGDIVSIQSALALLTTSGFPGSYLCLTEWPEAIQVGRGFAVLNELLRKTAKAKIVEAKIVEQAKFVATARAKASELGYTESVLAACKVVAIKLDAMVTNGSFLLDEQTTLDETLVQNCWLTHGAGRGLAISAASAKVNDNVIQRTSGSGIALGGDRLALAGPVLESCELRNNILTDVQQVSSSTAAIVIGTNTAKLVASEIKKRNVVHRGGKEDVALHK